MYDFNFLFGIAYILSFLLILFAFENAILQQVYGDGLTQENLPPASLGDREGSLFVKINPPIYTTETEGDAYMQFRLFDAKTNETVQHVTYDITVDKGANPAENEKPLVRDFFHAHNGLLTMKVEPTNGSLTIFGDRDPFQAAYVADPGGTINLKGPVLQEGGLYRFDIQIFGIDNDRNIFVPEEAPQYETFLSVGDVYNFENLSYEGRTFNSTLISYYDKVEDFNFNSNSSEFSWSMPFYYNVTRLQENPLFIHEEIKLPKALFGSSTFNATVNGQPVSDRTLAIDPFTSPDAVILHYLINKNDVIKIANEWQQKQGLTMVTETDRSNATTNAPSPQSVSLGGAEQEGNGMTGEALAGVGGARNNQNITGTMEFNLKTTQPGSPTTSTADTSNGTSQGSGGPSPSSANATSTDLLSDTGGIHASVSWSPAPPRMNIESSVGINFTDAFAGVPLNADVLYDLSVLDSNGNQVFEKKGLTAKDSQDTQAIKFPAAGTYQLVLTITGLQSQPDQQSSTPPPIDRTRNGIARGSIVVSGETNETATAPAAATAPTPAQSNNSLTGQQPEPEPQQNQTAPAAAQEQNPFEQLGQAISNMFGGGN